MHLLVTGGAGFIGANFVRYWLEAHPTDRITVLDSLTYAGDKKNLSGLDATRLALVHGDIRNPEAVRVAMEGIDTVVHFAAESHVDRSIEGSRVFLDTNVLGTQVLLEEATRRGDQIKRFHHVSTDEVFGALRLEDKHLFTEKTPYAPRSPYSASKAASDHLVRSYFYTHSVPITISNCSNNYGPYQHVEKFIPQMIMQAIENKPLPIYGDGLYVRDWIHVLDHCRGIEAVLLQGKVGETYCLGGDAERSNIEVAKLILDTLKKPHGLLSFVPDRKGHDRRYAIDCSRAKKELDWEPKIHFAQGLEATISWYQRRAKEAANMLDGSAKRV